MMAALVGAGVISYAIKRGMDDVAEERRFQRQMSLAEHQAAAQEKQRQRDSEAQKRQVELDCPRPE